ncbi:Hypothetical protein R9X50_00447200 [Acrodontium crateriforme]|uniref:2-dehydropantoate 2-reductase n=1 Tax=Acrodontium crateriforme TaxID=150365 RepID=A0AAQ3M5I5_9PEZI|nr:Hypothetical protein R9X50_00447200 [Acrodontium crateriforme]
MASSSQETHTNPQDDASARAKASQDPLANSPYEEYDKNKMSAVDRQYAALDSNLPKRIYVIGTGSIGKLVAHSLRGAANPPPVTLMLHRYSLMEAWKKGKKRITIRTGKNDDWKAGFQAELLPQTRRQHKVTLREGQPNTWDLGDNVRPHEAAQILQEQIELENEDTETQKEVPMFENESQEQSTPQNEDISDEPIYNLIICTKAARTLAALTAIRHRLSSSSTICFLQNGMGTIDEINAELFPDPETRPTYIQGIITHGVNVPREMAERDPFFAVHAGQGTIALGILPREETKPSSTADEEASLAQASTQLIHKTDRWAPSARYIIRTLTRIPVLCAVGFTPAELLQHQLEKLAINSILNPLTALLDTRNGGILYNFALTRTMRLLLAETSLVIRSLPELHGIPNVNTRFSPERLETLVVSVANQTKENISSMLADIRAGRQTEIKYINGYIVKRGEELGVQCVVNYAIMQTVIGKALITQREADDDVPQEINYS